MATTFDPDRYFSSGEWKDAINPVKNHYKCLGLSFDDTPSLEKINNSFQERYECWRDVNKRYTKNPANPKTKDTGPCSTEAMEKIQEAKDTLTDSAKRTEYDKSLDEINKKAKEEEFSKFVCNFITVQKKVISQAIKKNLLEHAVDISKITTKRAEEIIDCEMNKVGARYGYEESSTSPETSSNYYELLEISQTANNAEIEEAYKKQFSIWNSRATNPKFRDEVPRKKKLLQDARDTLTDHNRREEYDRQLKEAIETPPSTSGGGTPKLEISKTNFIFSNMRKGAVVSDSFTISNVGGGILSGPIKTNKKWLKVSQNNIDTTKHKQDIAFHVDTSGLAFGFMDMGTIEIQSNGGTESVNVTISIEPNIAALKRRNKYVGLGVGLSVIIYIIVASNVGSVGKRNADHSQPTVSKVETSDKQIRNKPEETPVVLENPLQHMTDLQEIWHRQLNSLGIPASEKPTAQLPINYNLNGEWEGKVDNKPAKLSIVQDGNSLSGNIVYEFSKTNVTEHLSGEINNDKIVLKGTGYTAKGITSFLLDTFQGGVSADANLILGFCTDEAGNSAKWFVKRKSKLFTPESMPDQSKKLDNYKPDMANHAESKISKVETSDKQIQKKPKETPVVLENPLLHMRDFVEKGNEHKQSSSKTKESVTKKDEELPPEYKQGIFYAKNGQYEKAIAEWLKALEKRNENIEIYYNLGIAYTKVGKPDNAIAVWQKALSINPLSANLHYIIGLAYKEKGNLELAEASFKKTMEIDPNYPEVKNILEKLYLSIPDQSKKQDNYKPKPTIPAILDTSPPLVSSTSPKPDATDVDINNPITVTFSEAIDTTTINAHTFTVEKGSGSIDGIASCSNDGVTATFVPSRKLLSSTRYTVTVKGVKDLAGNPITDGYQWNFTTLSKQEILSKEEVETFIKKWLPLQNISEAMPLYADKVDYYDYGLVDKAFVENFLASAVKTHPYRKDKLTSSIKIIPGNIDNEKIAKFTAHFIRGNDKTTIEGDGNAEITLRKQKDHIVIVREKGKIEKQQTKDNPALQAKLTKKMQKTPCVSIGRTSVRNGVKTYPDIGDAKVRFLDNDSLKICIARVTINCTWSSSDNAYVGTWRDDGSRQGKIKLFPQFDSNNKIKCFYGDIMSYNGNDYPEIPIRIDPSPIPFF